MRSSVCELWYTTGLCHKVLAKGVRFVVQVGAGVPGAILVAGARPIIFSALTNIGMIPPV
jgi:hypothetical protein